MPITQGFKTEAWDSQGDAPLYLLRITHADLPSPRFLVNDREGVISNGDIHDAFGFEVQPPSIYHDAPPQAQLSIDNVSREIAQELRTISSPPTVRLQVVRRATPDTVEVEWDGLRLINITVESLKITGDLLFENLVQEPYPGRTFSPAEYPGLVGG